MTIEIAPDTVITTDTIEFMDWLRELNDILYSFGQPEIRLGAARFWFRQNVTPAFAAEAISTERRYP